MIYFDNAATTMKKPKEVIDAVVKAMNSAGNSGRGVNSASLDASRIIYNARSNIAKFFNAENPKNIVFTNNSTESLNIAINGLLEKGDHVVTTALEHNSVLRPLYKKEKEGVELSFVKSDLFGNIDYEQFEKLIKPNTKAFVCTNASNLTGNHIDISKISKVAQKHGILIIVDASQSAGVFEIDVEKMGADVLCFTGHKGLLGPQGTGGMYVKEGVDIKTFKTGGTGIDTYNQSQPQFMPTKLEAGTLNTHGIAGLNAGIDYINKIGIDNIREKEQSLMKRFYYGVKNIENVIIYGDFKNLNRCAIVALNIGDYDSSIVSEELVETYNIATRPGAHCAPLMHKALKTVEQGAVRFSFSHYNTEEEVDFAIDAIKKIAK